MEYRGAVRQHEPGAGRDARRVRGGASIGGASADASDAGRGPAWMPHLGQRPRRGAELAQRRPSSSWIVAAEHRRGPSPRPDCRRGDLRRRPRRRRPSVDSRERRSRRTRRAARPSAANLIGWVSRSADRLGRRRSGVLRGVQLAGAAYVPLDPTVGAERLGHIVELAALDRLLVVQPGGPTLGVRRRSCSSTFGDGARSPPAGAGEAVAGLAASGGRRCAPGDTAYVMFTSGSTGRPRGVEVSHANLAASTAGSDRTWYGHEPDRFLRDLERRVRQLGGRSVLDAGDGRHRS